MYKYKHIALFGIVLFLTFSACSSKKERLVQQAVAQQVADFTKKEKAKCRTQLLEEAGAIADSLLLHEALAEVQDSLKRLLPFKPIAPPAIPPIDSLMIKPIFEQ